MIDWFTDALLHESLSELLSPEFETMDHEPGQYRSNLFILNRWA